MAMCYINTNFGPAQQTEQVQTPQQNADTIRNIHPSHILQTTIHKSYNPAVQVVTEYIQL